MLIYNIILIGIYWLTALTCLITSHNIAVPDQLVLPPPTLSTWHTAAPPKLLQLCTAVQYTVHCTLYTVQLGHRAGVATPLLLLVQGRALFGVCLGWRRHRLHQPHTSNTGSDSMTHSSKWAVIHSLSSSLESLSILTSCNTSYTDFDWYME